MIGHVISGIKKIDITVLAGICFCTEVRTELEIPEAPCVYPDCVINASPHGIEK